MGTGRRLKLFFLIDAFPWRLAERTGFLADLLPVRRPLRTILGYSSGALPTLFTGRMPKEHGHWAMYLRSPHTSPFRFLRWLAPFGRLADRPRVRIWADRRVRRSGGVDGYFSLYAIPIHLLPELDLCERTDIFSPGAFRGYDSLFDLMRGVPHRVWTWRTPEEENRRELLEAIRSGANRCLFFYSAHLDGVMHRSGVWSQETRRELDGYADLVGRAVEEAGRRYDHVSVDVCSDHGMKDTVEHHDLLRLLAELPAREGRDYLGFYDSTMARFWFTGDRGRREIEDLLGGLPFGRVLETQDLHELGLDFEDDRYGQLLFLMDPGTQIVPSYMGSEGPRAMHGYHPDDPDSYGVFLSSGAPERPPDHIRDLHAVWSRELEDGGEAA